MLKQPFASGYCAATCTDIAVCYLFSEYLKMIYPFSVEFLQKKLGTLKNLIMSTRYFVKGYNATNEITGNKESTDKEVLYNTGPSKLFVTDSQMDEALSWMSDELKIIFPFVCGENGNLKFRSKSSLITVDDPIKIPFAKDQFIETFRPSVSSSSKTKTSKVAFLYWVDTKERGGGHATLICGFEEKGSDVILDIYNPRLSCTSVLMSIGNPLSSSPDFPPTHTVHATFTAHGVPSSYIVVNPIFF
jgi:hypothetical protein